MLLEPRGDRRAARGVSAVLRAAGWARQVHGRTLEAQGRSATHRYARSAAEGSGRSDDDADPSSQGPITRGVVVVPRRWRLPVEIAVQRVVLEAQALDLGLELLPVRVIRRASLE